MPTLSERVRRRPVGVLAVAVLTALVVLLSDGGQSFWICVPAAMLASVMASTRLGAIAAGVAVVAGAVAPSLASSAVRPPPSTPLAWLVPAASVAILLAVRERLRDERDALRATTLRDPLTGVSNRRSLIERGQYEISRHTRIGHSFCVVMLDLDGFKGLNDRFGHAAGDDLLRDVAEALGRAMRDQDTVARLGGDEFCVLAPETDEGGAQRLEARTMAAVGRVTAGIDALGASAGAAVFPDDGTTIESLLEAADQRLLEVKRHRQKDRPRRRAA